MIFSRTFFHSFWSNLTDLWVIDSTLSEFYMFVSKNIEKRIIPAGGSETDAQESENDVKSFSFTKFVQFLLPNSIHYKFHRIYGPEIEPTSRHSTHLYMHFPAFL